MTTDIPDVSITYYNTAMEFERHGIVKEFVSDFDEEKFECFVDELAERFPGLFRQAQELVEEEAIVRIATPKPSSMDFDRECDECREKIEKEDIHVEITEDVEEWSEIWICKNCFLQGTENRSSNKY